ncbi:MAG: hypothetical protein ACI4HJ_01590 [Ruminococcus sp.]
MKKLFALALVVLMVCSLAACASGSSAGSNAPGNINLFGTTAAENSNTNIGGNNTVVSGDSASLTKDSKNVYLLNTDEFSFLVENVKVDPDSYYIATMEVKAENKTEDKGVTFSIEDTTIDNIMAYGSYYKNLKGGDISSEDIEFSFPSLPDGLDYKAEDACSISFTFVALDDDYNQILKLPVTIYLKDEGLTKAYERKTLPTDKIIYNENGIKLTYIGLVDSYGLGEAFFCLENTGSFEAYASFTDTKINGKDADLYFSSTADPGTTAFSYIFIGDSALEEVGLKELSGVKELSFTLEITDYDSYEEIANEKITIEIK